MILSVAIEQGSKKMSDSVLVIVVPKANTVDRRWTSTLRRKEATVKDNIEHLTTFAPDEHDVPKIHYEDSAVDDHSVSFDHYELQIPLQLNGVFSCFHTKVHTERELHDCEKIFLTPDSSDCDPHFQSYE